MKVLNSIKYKFDRQTSDDLKANGFICFEEKSAIYKTVWKYMLYYYRYKYLKRNFGVFFCIFILFFYDDKNSVSI